MYDFSPHLSGTCISIKHIKMAFMNVTQLVAPGTRSCCCSVCGVFMIHTYQTLSFWSPLLNSVKNGIKFNEFGRVYMYCNWLPKIKFMYINK